MAGLGLGSPFIRQAELADIHMAINGENCRAVFLSYDTGLGASTILRELALESGQDRPVLSLQGTPSLSAVPFGALAPILRGVRGDNLGLRTQVFRAVLTAIDELRGSANGDRDGLPLIVLDDAHAVDTSTAELLVKSCAGRKCKSCGLTSALRWHARTLAAFMVNGFSREH